MTMQIASSGWASPTLGRVYAEIDQLRLNLAQPPDSDIDVSLRIALDAIENADNELLAVSS